MTQKSGRHSNFALNIRANLLTSVALVVLAPPAMAQENATLTAADAATLIHRIEQLEATVNALQAQNKDLTDQIEVRTERLERVETKVAKAAAPTGLVPSFSDTAGNFTFKLRGVLDVDYAGYTERRGGFGFSNGTAFRRARLGLEGTAFRDLAWRIEADFAGNAVQILDGYLQYNGIPHWQFTAGQFKAPFGLESNNSDSFNTFIERSMAGNAFGNAGAERRIGIAVAYLQDNLTATLGFSGDNESVNRNNGGPGESWGGNGRVTWEPYNDGEKIIHIGAAGYVRRSLKTAASTTTTVRPVTSVTQDPRTGRITTTTTPVVVTVPTAAVSDSLRLTERPGIRVDGSHIADTGIITNVKTIYYAGAEAAGVYGPISVFGEYGHLFVDRDTRIAGVRNVEFEGYYAYASYFLTGESRSFKNGNFDRLRPLHDFDRQGGWGAWELAFRYDKFDLSATPVANRAGNDAETLTTALNWYLNGYIKLQFNWIRFRGTNTPLAALPTVGTSQAGDAYATRLHLDW